MYLFFWELFWPQKGIWIIFTDSYEKFESSLRVFFGGEMIWGLPICHFFDLHTSFQIIIRKSPPNITIPIFQWITQIVTKPTAIINFIIYRIIFDLMDLFIIFVVNKFFKQIIFTSIIIGDSWFTSDIQTWGLSEFN